jgi:uncharacterized protein (TIGR03435 family)
VKIICATVVGILSSTLLIAQAPERRVEFEVATVRPSPLTGPAGSVSVGVKMDGAQARIGSLPLRQYISMAYRIKLYQIVGPEWLATERFEVSAKLPDGSTAAQIPHMLQSLLADRFGLRSHREPKEMPVYALTLGKPPLRLKNSVVDPNAPAPTGVVAVSGSGSAAGVAIDLGNGSSYTFAGGKFQGKKIDARIMADLLQQYTDRPVVDMTGLTGTYDLAFEVTPEDYQTLLIRSAVNAGVTLPPQALRLLDNGGDPLGDALAQLGLKLDSRRAPVELFVVDQILKTPTDN